MLRFLAASSCGLALILSAGLAQAQDISGSRLSDGIRTISDDSFQGRLPGTDGERMTLAWLQAQYEAMGLQPGGPDGQWLQTVELSRFTPASPATASWRGPDGQVHALAGADGLLIRSATNDGQADIDNAELVFAGYGISAPERGWDDYGDLDVTGKVVIVFGGEPDGDLFNGDYATTYQSGAYKADEAFRRGAVGILTVAPIVTTSPQWAGMVGGSSRRRTLTPGAANLEFTGTLAHDLAAQWAAASGMDMSRMINLGDGQFRAMPIPGVTLSVHSRETNDPLVTHNLLARIEGTERPNETIIFSAHWDHVGVNENAPGDDKIFNGAWDNASGTVGVVEVAHAFAAGPRPARSVVFAHMAAEEMGLLGSYAYTANPVWPLETTVADINIDMLPLSAPTRDIAIFGKGQNDLEDRLEVLAAAEGRYVTDDREPEQGYYYRSDHFPFARAGVPALMPWHGVDLDEGGIEAGLPAYQSYFSAHYHRASDQWSPELDFSSAVENLTLLYRLGLDLANGTDWPTWKPTSEFGQARARSDMARHSHTDHSHADPSHAGHSMTAHGH